MFIRFTENARMIMAIAVQQAQQLNHKYIETEHIFLGLLKHNAGKAALVLKNLGVDTGKMLSELEQLNKLKVGTDIKTKKKPKAKKFTRNVIKYAIKNAKSMNHKYVGTEHLLLGLLRESSSIASQVLINLGVTIESARLEIEKLTNQKE
jgi:ATP-dependent Clp protease ATP-binding subunit ClpC